MGGFGRFDTFSHGGRVSPLSVWLALVVTALSIVVADGRTLSASIGRAAPLMLTEVGSLPSESPTSAAVAPVALPDFRLVVTDVADGQAGQPFSYVVQVRNDGEAGGGVRFSTTLPPAFSNVHVNAPGFACTRQFTPSGPEAGTLVACSRNNLERGATAAVTIEANAPAVAGEYRLLATADSRDDVPEAEENNNQVVVTVRVGA